jgi:hypothetical protein
MNSYERAPTLVAEYEEPSPPPSYSHLASETSLPDTANNASALEPRKQKLSTIEARFARLEGMLSEQRNKELARAVSVEEIILPEVATIRSNFQTSTDPTPGREPNNDGVVRNADPNDGTQGLSTALPKRKQRKKKESAKAPELAIANSSKDTEIRSYSVDPETIFDVNIFQEPDSDAVVDNAAIVVEPEVELSTRSEKTFPSQRADEINATGLISELEKALLKFNLATEPDDKKKPIKFKDAVGRKFSFPFHLCSTWAVSLATPRGSLIKLTSCFLQGMEELIKQAFVHVDLIGPHVLKGQYDLIGPNGEIILPQVWETMIEPDWAITMHMWPMPEPKDPPPMPGPHFDRPRSRHVPSRHPRGSPPGPPPPPVPPPAWYPGRSPQGLPEDPKAKGVLGWMGRKIASAKKKVHLDGDDSDSSSDYRSLVDD